MPDNFSPFPKNPVIARVFKEIGRADELGSGVRNIFEYFNYYSLQKPILEEKDIFKCTVFTDKIEQETKGIKYVGDKVGDVGGNVGDMVGDVDDLSEEKRNNVGVNEKNDVINNKISENDEIKDEISEMNDVINENIDEINENKELTKSFMRIIEILQLFPKITIPELAQKIGISTKTTERKLLKMRSLEMIQRVGSRKSGSWYVIDKKHR